jgi:hypothetical protein
VEQLPGVIGFSLTVPAKLARGLDRLKKLFDDLLNTLRMQMRKTALRLLFPPRLTRPFPVHTPYTVMALHHRIPHLRRFLARQGEGLPLDFAVWKPIEFNRLICHAKDYTVGIAPVV